MKRNATSAFLHAHQQEPSIWKYYQTYQPTRSFQPEVVAHGDDIRQCYDLYCCCYHLKKLFNSQVVQEELSRKGTEWRFIPKRAPWYGGFWERLIGLTKTSLKKILGRRYVSMETLQTIVTEIEAVINDRPLTHVSSNIDDLEPLTPSHLLYGRKMTSLPH